MAEMRQQSMNVCIEKQINNVIPFQPFLFIEFHWPISFNDEMYAMIFPTILFPINNIIFIASIFLTIVIAYER